MTLLSARAIRTSSPFIALPSACASGASTMKCAWLPCTEKCTRRNPNLWQPRSNARRSARKQRWERRFQTSRRMRTVTCSAPLRNGRRTRCGTFWRADVRLHPAPRRAPPHCRNGSSCCSFFMREAWMGGLTFLEARDDAAGRSPARCPLFQVVSGEALRCRQSPICAGSVRLIWAHLPFCALASSRPGAWFRVRTDARMIIRAGLDWADIVAHSAPPRLRCTRSARPRPVAHAPPMPARHAPPHRRSVLRTPRCSIPRASAWSRSAPIYPDPEVIRFVEPAPLDRGRPGGGSPCTSVTGYSFRRESWGRGFASVAAGACARYAYDVLKAPAVVSLVHPDNVRSQRVAERGGAKVEREMVLRGLPARVFLWPQH